jgi:RNA polymerase sigma-70 factor (ECF subfamily)
MSGSPEEAHELVHDAFLKVWQTREALTLVKSFRDYVFCIARNKLFDQAKHEKVKQKANAWFRGVEATITAPDEILLLKQYQRLGQEAIDSLSGQKKKIFLMRTQEELKMAEIATIMGISTAAVKKHFYQSVQLVKKYLLNHADWTFVLLGLCDHLVHVARQTAS